MKNTCKNTCKNPPLGGSEIFNSFQGLETGWLARQFLGNRLATSEGAVSNTQLLTVPYGTDVLHVTLFYKSYRAQPRP